MGNKQKQTIEQKLHARKIKRPPSLIYSVLGGVWKLLFFKKYGVQVKFNYDFRKEKGPHILLSNHASRMDYIFTALPLLKHKYNFVAGYNEFFRSHLVGIFGLMQVIPKKNFTPDVYTVKSVSRVLKDGGKVVLFPEGMNSISGANQPVAVGTGKFVKHFKVPVYYALIEGGYLTNPKYTLDERPGTVRVTFDRMFTPEEIDSLTPEQIEEKINELLYHDDFKWNLEHDFTYSHPETFAEGLHNLLYRCPKCGTEFRMEGKGNVIKCHACGNGATLDATYKMIPLDNACVIPATQTEWFNEQREYVKQEVSNPDFVLTEEVELGMLPQYKMLDKTQTSEIVGKGTLTLTRAGLAYEGTGREGAFTFFIPSLELPTYGMCTDMSRFYTFYKGEFVEFYPKTACVEKWFLATEEIHRLNGGKWKDFTFQK